MRKSILIFTLVTIWPLQQACADGKSQLAPQRQASSASSSITANDSTVMIKNETPPPNGLSKGEFDAKWYEGTLQFKQLEGGFYGFTSNQGERLLPLNLAKDYHQDGAKLRLFGYIQKDVHTFQQWGKPFKVLKVELLTPGKKPNNRNL